MKRMNSKDYAPEGESAEIFKKYYDDPENTRCFECRAAARHWISVNNAISLCGGCAEQHMKFGSDISLVKNSKTSVWLPSELKMLEHGGNRRLQNFLASYIFEPNMSTIFKYKTLAAFYYRRKLRLESEGKKYEDELPHQEDHLKQIESESIFDSIASGFSKVGVMITGAYERAKSGVHESHLLDDIQHKASEVTGDVKNLASSGYKALKEGFNNAVDMLLEFQGTDVRNVSSPMPVQPENIPGENYEFIQETTAADQKGGLRGTGDIIDNKNYQPLSKEVPEVRHLASKEITREAKHEKAGQPIISKGFDTDKELPKAKHQKREIMQVLHEKLGEKPIDAGYISDEEDLDTKDKGTSVPSLEERVDVLSTLAREASDEVRKHDPSKNFDQKKDETFPGTKLGTRGKVSQKAEERKEESFKAEKLTH